MKKFLVLLGVLLVFAITCPTADDHKEAIKNAIKEATSKEIKNFADQAEGLGAFADMLGAGLVSGIANVALEGFLTVDKYIVFSVGKINYDGEQRVVSVGALNYVYTFSADDLSEAMNSTE